MKKTVLLILTIVMASVMGGCSFFSDASDAKKELEATAKKPIPKANSQPENLEATEEVEGEEEFADLEEEGETTQAIAGLIPATDPDSRVRSSVRGRQDPFSVVSLIPEIEIEQQEEKLAPVSNVNNPSDRKQGRVSRKSSSSSKSSNTLDEFRTKLARGVIISGLYKSNGRTKLIVRAPEEDNSRYVEVGEYLSNGQILVKSIDLNHFPTPLVILEQAGVEVAKVIGESPEDSEKQANLLPSDNLRNPVWVSNISLNPENIE